ncbi:leucine-rich repeat flightless-interacting protein 2 isoform X18 [Alosa sapidissima]|uniref:leucine-rich repeat flightless-interacting protein 2 isoform X18 n=1 Tax=Alosa sapidissima TaxID=34773 RepID=UPI001C0A4C65|nr:leucine-rich repeat flightless-interacting protein 2 isoform X18 [Alosa sapidissima]
MGTQGPGRKRIPNKERLTAEDDALNVIAREAEARLAAKRAARAEAREIRMKELERQQKEIYQVQKKYYGLDNKWGDIEQWMEDSERYSRHTRRHASNSDDEERMSVSSRGSVRSDLDAVGAYGGLGSERGSTSHSHKKSKKKKKKHSKASNGCDDDCSTVSGWSSKLSDESRHTRSSKLDLQPGSYRSSDLYGNSSLPSSRLQTSSYNGHQLSLLHDTTNYVRKRRGSLYEDSIYSSASSRRYTGSAARVPSEYSGFLGSSSRTSSRASSACASPVEDCGGSVASFLRSAANTSSLPRDLDHVTIPDLSDVSGRVDDRLDRDYLEKGSRASTISSATLASLGGTSSRRGSGDTSITADTETSIREIKEIHELKDQIQDVEAKYMQSLKELKDTLTEMEEKYRKAMVSNAQLDNDKCNLMYQVDIQKDSLMELEELLFETRREYDEKAKELEREKHAHSILQFQFSELKQTLKQSEELLTEIRQLNLQRDGYVREVADLQETLEWKDKKIGALERQKEYSDAIRNERDELRDEVVQLKDILKKHGIVLGPDFSTNGEAGESGDGTGQADSDTKTSPTEGSSVLEIRLRKLVDERENLIEQVKNLKLQLDQRKPRNGTDNGSSPEGEIVENGSDPNIIDVQNANRLISDLKFKLVKSEQEVTALEQNISRLEGQVTRYKSASENAEKIEDELKAEKRKMQRELRSALDKVDELEASNSHLNKRLEKIKVGRGNATSPQ